MKNYKVLTNSRGFLLSLYSALEKKEGIHFEYTVDSIYEKPSMLRFILSKLIRMKIFDFLGVFRIININKKYNNYDGYYSYNRFVKGTKPYIIYLENPYALVNYCKDRMNYLISNKKLNKCFQDPNLKGIVCMSKVCMETLPNIYKIPSSINIYQIYPLLEEGKLEKSFDTCINCLFIASEFILKGGLEVIEAFKKLKEQNIIFNLTVVTPLNDIESQSIKELNELGAKIFDYTLTKKEIQALYHDAHIILNPTRADSFNLVTLESMKYGCVYVGTSVYAICEMIKEGHNGFLIKPRYSIWNENNLLDNYVNKYKKQTIYLKNVDEKVTKFIIDNVKRLDADRVLLRKMCLNAYKRSQNEDFSSNSILKKWSKIL